MLLPVLLAAALALPVHHRRIPERVAAPECVVPLPSGGGLDVRVPERAFGQAKTVRLLREAVAKVRRNYPGTPDLPVGDLSFRGGGRMRPHRSHRTGYDVDIGYYFKDRRPRRYFQNATPKTLDVAREWALLTALMETGEVEYLFVSYPLQAALYAHAKKQGVSERALRELFQWPRPARRKAGIIRLERGHTDHLHVRFRKD